MTVGTIQTNSVAVANIENVQTLRIEQDKTVYEKLVDGALHGTGMTVAGFVALKVCSAVYYAFAGAETGATVGSALGPAGTVVGIAVGGTLGAVTGMIA